ncbi:hypothetical protein Tco_1384647 [Tanacetum coccineum]
MVRHNNTYFVVKKCRNLLKNTEYKVKLEHCYHEANRAAHWLANHRCEQEEGLLMFDSAPPNLGSILLEDLKGVAWHRSIIVDRKDGADATFPISLTRTGRGCAYVTGVMTIFNVRQQLEGHAGKTNVLTAENISALTMAFGGKRCEKNYLSVRRYVADPDNAYPKRSITKLILKGAVIFDVVSYQFRCALNYSKVALKRSREDC